MKTRYVIPELMDDPELAREDHFHALRGLRRINAWTGTASLLWRAIVQLAKTNDLRPLRVLDVATGAGDIPIELCKRAAREHVDIDIEACDVSEQALEFAEEQCHRAGASVRFFQHDVIQRKIPFTYDVVMCSQFLHHLTKQQAEDVLRTMMEAAEHRVFVVDLVRSRFNWLQVWLATRSLTKSKDRSLRRAAVDSGSVHGRGDGVYCAGCRFLKFFDTQTLASPLCSCWEYRWRLAYKNHKRL